MNDINNLKTEHQHLTLAITENNIESVKLLIKNLSIDILLESSIKCFLISAIKNKVSDGIIKLFLEYENTEVIYQTFFDYALKIHPIYLPFMVSELRKNNEKMKKVFSSLNNLYCVTEHGYYDLFMIFYNECEYFRTEDANNFLLIISLSCNHEKIIKYLLKFTNYFIKDCIQERRFPYPEVSLCRENNGDDNCDETNIIFLGIKTNDKIFSGIKIIWYVVEKKVYDFYFEYFNKMKKNKMKFYNEKNKYHDVFFKFKK